MFDVRRSQIIHVLRRVVPSAGPPTRAFATEPLVIDLTSEPSWEEVGDLAEDFDHKLELFMKFEDGSGDSDRNWLMT